MSAETHETDVALYEPWRAGAMPEAHLGSLPVLSDMAESLRALWREQLGACVATMTMRARLLADSEASLPLPSLRARMSALQQATLHSRDDLVRWFAAVGISPRPDTAPYHGKSPLFSGWLQLVRDWSFGDESGENAACVEDLSRVLPEGENLGRLLVLGVGGGRAAYDLEQRSKVRESFWLDTNPLSLLLAQRVLEGEEVPAIVLPHHPSTGEAAVRMHTLKRPVSTAPNVKRRLIVADARVPPFEPGAFDTVFTPFYIDQVHQSTWGVLRTIHAMLRPGGRWIQRGPLQYGERPVWERLTPAEMFEAIEHVGFRVASRHQARHAHCVHPEVTDLRTLDVHTWVAVRDDRPAAALTDLRWLCDPNLPIPLPPDVVRNLPVGAMLVEHIDGRRTSAQVAARVREKSPSPSLLGARLAAIRDAYFFSARSF